MPESLDMPVQDSGRESYGYSDTAYFFLKIRAAFPGKVR